MRIYPPPVRESIPSNNWSTWFDLVFKAIQNFGGLQKVYSGTATLDFPSVSAGSTVALNITVPGVKLDTVTPSRVSIGTVPATGIVYDAYVSADDTVTIRANNISTALKNPVPAVFSITVWSYT